MIQIIDYEYPGLIFCRGELRFDAEQRNACTNPGWEKDNIQDFSQALNKLIFFTDKNQFSA